MLDMRFAHSVTDTAPGHAALYTALVPRENGIYANDRLDPQTRRSTSIFRDEATHLVGEGGVLEAHGSSLAPLVGETVADRLRAERPDSFIVALSLKDRGAMFAGGRKPDASIWYDQREGLVTSTAFATELPLWARGGAKAIAAATAKPWTLLDDAFVRANALTPDDQSGEGDAGGLGRTFPHPAPASTPIPTSSVRYTPAADELLLALGLAAVDARGKRPMFLSLSLSTHDYVGHVWGPDSWEAWDELAHLDAALARFFVALDARVGPRGWAVVLSADHGATSMPEAVPLVSLWCKPGAPPDRRARPCGPATRVVPAMLADELEEAAERALGGGNWILGLADPYLYFTREALALPESKRDALESAIRNALARHPEVARVEKGGKRASCEPGESIESLICRSLTDASTGALYIALTPGSYFESGHAIGRGASHGSPYLFDRSVPLIVRAPGAASGVVVSEPVPFESHSRTLCSALGLGCFSAARQGRDFTAPAR